MIIPDFLIETANNFPNKTAVVYDGIFFPYSDLLNKSNSIARSIKSKSHKNSIVSLLLPNSVDFISAYFGILRSGNICHIISPSVSDESLNYQIKHIQPDVLISNNSQKKKLKRSGVSDRIKFLEVNSISNEELKQIITNKDDSEIASIIFTSGTTSKPKAIKITHKNVASTTERIVNYLKISDKDIDVISLPLSHSFGLGCLHCIIKQGGTVILHRNTINLKEIILSIKKYSATSFAGVPTTLRMILDNYKNLFKNSITSLRYVLTNSAPMPREMIQELLSILNNKKLCTYYGLTEASRCTFHTYNDITFKIDSVGKPLPGIQITIVDNKKICKPFQKGEVNVRGTNVSPGYWNDLEADKKIQDGWLKTGDIGYFDDDGFLYLMGRTDDIINTGGEKVAPKEIEDVLYLLEEIQEAVVKGVSDRLLGQTVKAFIVLKDDTTITEKEIIQHCSKKLESYKIPRHIEYVKNIPKNEQGKILRNLL